MKGLNETSSLLGKWVSYNREGFFFTPSKYRNTAQKMIFSIKDFLSKCDQIRSTSMPKCDFNNVAK